MKRMIYSLFAIIALLSILPSCAKEQKEVLKVGLEENLEPYCYYSENGEVNGVYVDAVKMIADRSEKYDVEFAAYPRSELTEMLESGEIDCFVSKYSSEFDGYLKSESFFYSGCAFLVMADSMYHDAKKTDEIKNADICSLGGSAEGATFDLADVTYYETLDEVKTALDGGAHDGFAGDYLIARVLRTKLEFDNAFRLFPDAMLEGDDNCHCLYFKSENENMVYGVNNGIAKLTVDDVTQSAETHVEILT